MSEEDYPEYGPRERFRRIMEIQCESFSYNLILNHPNHNSKLGAEENQQEGILRACIDWS